jgi:hypothetical protein
LKRSLSIRETALGSDHPSVAGSLNNLGQLYLDQGRDAEAEPLLKRSVAIYETALGPDHPHVTAPLNNLAWLAYDRSDWQSAAGYWRRNTAVVARRTERGLAGTAEDSAKGEAFRLRDYFLGLLKMTHRLAAEGRAPGIPAADMLETAQWAQASEAAASLAHMAARSAAGSAELAALMRERHDLAAKIRAMEKHLIAAKSLEPAWRNVATETKLARDLAELEKRFKAIDWRLDEEFPDYAALARPPPLSAEEAQAQLGPDEALVLFLDTPEWKPKRPNSPSLPQETFVWIVTKTEVRWVRSELGTVALQREVAALRCGLDATAWHGKGALHCADVLKLAPGKVPKDGQPLPFDAARAHVLYASLFGGARDLINGKHLLVVPSGALTTLPLQVLVTEAPASPDLAKVRWLVRDHAITVLPSAGSLMALRRTAKPSIGAKPMLGFANPLLDGDENHPKDGAWYKREAQRARTQTGCATTPKRRTAALRAIIRSATPVPQTAGLADLAHLRMQTPLPETADEPLVPKMILQSTRPYRAVEEEPNELAQICEVNFEPERDASFSDVLDHVREGAGLIWPLLRRTSEALASTLDLAMDAEYITSRFDAADHDVPSVANHPQNELSTGFLPLVRLCAELWVRAARMDAGRARTFAQAWKSGKLRITSRL